MKSINLAIDEIHAAGIGCDGDRLNTRRRFKTVANMRAQGKGADFTVDIKFGFLAVGRNQDNAFRRRFTRGQDTSFPVDFDNRFILEQAQNDNLVDGMDGCAQIE